MKSANSNTEDNEKMIDQITKNLEPANIFLVVRPQIISARKKPMIGCHHRITKKPYIRKIKTPNPETVEQIENKFRVTRLISISGSLLFITCRAISALDNMQNMQAVNSNNFILLPPILNVLTRQRDDN
jgi:hypothetical protein